MVTPVAFLCRAAPGPRSVRCAGSRCCVLVMHRVARPGDRSKPAAGPRSWRPTSGPRSTPTCPADGREAGPRRASWSPSATLASPFDEQAGPEHVTGSAVVVGRRGTVLHMHKRLHRWLQPGGHLEPGEGRGTRPCASPRRRPAWSLAHPDGGPRLIHVDVHDAANGHTHLDLRYLLVAPDGDPAPPPGESPEARWFGWEEADGRGRRGPRRRAAGRPPPARGRWRERGHGPQTGSPGPGRGRHRRPAPAQWS